jgi:hypothetical protein
MMPEEIRELPGTAGAIYRLVPRGNATPGRCRVRSAR